MNFRNVSLKTLAAMAAHDDDAAEYVADHGHYKNKPQRGGKRFVNDSLVRDEPRANRYEVA